MALHVGIADHLGWAVVVTTTGAPAGEVVDRRRIELLDADLSAAPIHYDRGRSTDAECAALVAEVRASARRGATAAFDELAGLGAVSTLSLRAWPADFPTDIAVLRQVPWESRADAVMYRQVLAEVARDRGWAAPAYLAKDVLGQATALLGGAERAADVLDGPRATLGPPWTKDHRVALAATIVASAAG